ncbi:MAG: type I-D CRISPR-associated helicase Cas3' [Chloroflexi bacterium]|nr:type I-D CRISPR-associated helicase Cas3' [Chloroflexota bacterium]
MNKITTLPVYSKLADKIALPTAVSQRQPDHIHLSEHQLETYNAVIGEEYDVVINTAMTGDGKSLAAYLPSLLHGESLLGMYPTNELARDQQENLPATMKSWGCKLTGPTRMTAADLDKLVRENKVRSKRGGIDLLTDNNEIILTNPDIFHYLAQFFYTTHSETPDMRFMRRIVNNFEYFIFDEFHIFEAPQVVAVVNTLLLIREFSRNKKRFLFLSATPDNLLVEYLEKADFKVKVVDTNGRYRHTRDSLDSAQWRPIIRESDIFFDALTPDYRIEQWIDGHIDEILQFFREQPVAKGAIIVNSVASAYRLKDKLQPEFEKIGRTAELNTGLSSDEIKKISRECDLLIGTSTVDVGVDFKINFLIFESRDAGTFLQRLGRLGRHKKDDDGRSFTIFRAYALVPRYIEERLFKGKDKEPSLLANDAEINRETLAKAIEYAYPPPARFPQYARQWGWIQSTHVFYALGKKPIRETYQTGRKNLARYYQKLFHFSVSKAIPLYNDLRKDSKRKLLVYEAQSFRGSSPLQCGLIDMTDGQKIKKYSLISLMLNGRLQWIDPEEFKDIAAQSWGEQSQFDTDELLGWFRFEGFTDERRKLAIELNHQVRTWDANRLGSPQMLGKIGLNCDVDWINVLNRHMERRQFVVTVCHIHPAELRPFLYLPPMFRLFDYTDLDGQTGTITFAREALLLHVALQQRHVNCGGNAIIL